MPARAGERPNERPDERPVGRPDARADEKMTALLEVRNLTCGYGKKEIVHEASFSVARREFCCVIGANGSGKTTALKGILGLLPLVSGQVLVNTAAGVSVDTAQMKVRERARHFAYIPQLHIPPFPFKVADVVLLGRTPHLPSNAAGASAHDKRVAYQSMELLSIENLAEQEYTELSGGQQQLVLIARALAQEPDILIMDEPTASLDFGNQQLVLTRLHALSRSGMAVLMVTHDPDHALFCADTVVVMEDGKVIDQGSPSETIDSDKLRRIYRTEVYVADVEVGAGRMQRTCIPLRWNEKD
ncbi:MAG: ABC transporter ATP-binding protein [Coriobacteriales bacterium]|jgi:ABC-type cobalamin/Fe3+-siderophores transport system ATPase subunit|nr:ABC transporter ATP-binding protein [Coriobacteriales bacterium]